MGLLNTIRMKNRDKGILSNWLQRQIPRVIRRLDRIVKKEGNYQTTAKSILSQFRELFRYYYFDKNLEQARWCMEGMGAIFGHIEDVSWFYTKPTTDVSFLFLSNHKKVIDQYIVYEYPWHQILKSSGTEVYGPMVITELLLKNNREEARNELEYWKLSESYREKLVFYHRLMPFYEALFQEDVRVIEQSIHKVFTRDYHNYLIKHWHSEEKYFSSLANFCVKLSWMLGYEFQIEHPLIDMDIITMEPPQDYPTIAEIIVKLQELKFD